MQVLKFIFTIRASVEDNVWLYLQDLQVARSFAAADIVDGCLVVTGGDTELGPTDSVEIIEGARESHLTNNHFIMTQARAAPGPGVTSLWPGPGQVTAW